MLLEGAETFLEDEVDVVALDTLLDDYFLGRYVSSNY
jgi:hypothetical protein